jgi:hypothetical protein
MGKIPAPSWVSTGAVIAEGLDLLGLRQPVQSIGGNLLDGVTSVTPTIRYLSFSCWLLYRYAEARLPDNYEDFSAFEQRAEAALVTKEMLWGRRRWPSLLIRCTTVTGVKSCCFACPVSSSKCCKRWSDGAQPGTK